jgi:broad specificity phosphatase PhoE
MDFFFVRHGESAHNAAGLFCGTVDSPLTARGLRQAHNAAALLDGERLDWIVSSPLRRALDTATVIASGRALAVVVDGRLREHTKGVLEGTPYTTLRSWQWSAVVGAESMQALFERVSDALEDLTLLPGRGAVVAHAGVARAIECVRTGSDPAGLYELGKVANAEPYLITGA